MYKTQNGPVFSVNEVRTKQPDNGIRSEGIDRIYKMNRIARATTLPLHLVNLVNPVEDFLTLFLTCATGEQNGGDSAQQD